MLRVEEPGCKETAVGLSEYSWCRVQSPLVELTARHKTSCVGYQTAALYSDTVTDM